MLGTIIHATHRLEDLIPVFVDALPENERKAYQYPEEENHPFWESEHAQNMLNDLFDHLQEYAPECCYFGAHQGDGSDFGYWPDFGYIDDMAQDGDLLKVSDLSEVPGYWRGLVLLVNDHGNATLYSKSEDFTECWSII